MQIPLTMEQFTADWLSEALCEPVGAPPVRAFEFGGANSGTTGRAQLRLDYAGPTELPRQLFVKLPPDDEAQRAFVTEVGMGKREADFYRLLSEEVPVRVPRCYFADSDDRGERYIMLLEDLDQSGCTFRNSSTRYSLDYVREVLLSFARLHGAYWDSPRFETELAWLEAPRMHAAGARLVERGLARYGGEMPEIFSRLGEFYIDNAASVHALWGQGVPTLVHGDIHDGNMFYDPAIGASGAPGMLDWAIVGRTSCMRDVAYFMAGTLAPGDRTAYQDELLTFYFGELERTGVTLPPADELQLQYRWHVAYVWVAAVTTVAMGSEWQSLNYVLRTLERLNRAIEDCDCLGVLQEGLG